MKERLREWVEGTVEGMVEEVVEERNTVILGSGPAGYTAALYAARANLRPLLLKGLEAGGQLMLTTDVENYPGFPDGILGPEMMDAFEKQAARFETEIVAQSVTRVDLSERPFGVWAGDLEWRAKTLILATGASARWLGIPGEQKLRGRGVSACATCDGFFFRDRELVVVGGGDTAMEEATFLTKFASAVTLVHRRDEFRASKIMQERVHSNPKVEVVWDTVVEEVLGEGAVTGVRLRNVKSDEATEFATDGVFVAIGHDPNTDLVKGQVDLTDAGYVIVREPTTATSVPGVFAAGDVTDVTYRQAVTAAGQGCKAAIDAERYLEDDRVRNHEMDQQASGKRGTNVAMMGDVTDGDFEERVLGSEIPVLVDFWAEWCVPCHMVSPVVEEIGRDKGETLQVAKLNIDDNPEVTRRFGVMSIPTLMLFKGGQEIARVVGARGKDALLKEIDPHVPAA